ncbi:MAG: hypothetical protein QHH07_03910 [Sedimentisphaerales bacterium]|jgi:hypothetical protein|nr:hypothetical protein [Sedimentisphaerales bacterium]
MLAFMTDNQDSPNNGSAGPTPAESKVDPAPSPKARKARQTSLVLMVLFCIGAITLFLMIKKAQPQAASASTAKDEQSQIEAAIKRLTGLSDELATHMDHVMQRFRQLSEVAQVTVDQLVKNPFELELMAGLAPQVEVSDPPTTEPNTTTSEQEVQARIQAEQERIRLAELAAKRRAEEAARMQIRQSATALRLQGIFCGAEKFVCVLDGQLLTVGQKIKGFEVIGIRPESVDLRWPEPEMTFTLKIAE